MPADIRSEPARDLRPGGDPHVITQPRHGWVLPGPVLSPLRLPSSLPCLPLQSRGPLGLMLGLSLLPVLWGLIAWGWRGQIPAEGLHPAWRAQEGSEWNVGAKPAVSGESV